MRYFAALIAVLSLFTFSNASAQELLASNATFPTGRTNDKAPGAPRKESAEKIVLSGTITNPAGVLPGAVVILTSTKQMAVTNAEGEFEFVVPANAGPLLARVTYAGYADENMTLNSSAAESTVNLTNAQVIVIARKQRLKAYMKTAHKEVRRSLKQVHKK